VPNRPTETKSKYTADRSIPGAFEGETVTRRRFMNVWANGVGAVAAAAFTLPALGFAIAPIFKREPWEWQPIGPTSDFPANEYKTKVITTSTGIGEAGNTITYVRARNPSIDTEPEDQYNKFVALSSRCMHLGCPVRYVSAAERFICPCHGGVYDFRGMVAGGPPVRPLDRFYTRVNNGLVEIGPRYSVNNELRRFSPRFPGEPLDGVGQYLYPAQFATSQKP
jgi:menaquinol-cytochrome c reductase iron-sulfur subunit